MKQLLYIGFALVMLSAASCRKYVEIPPENVRQLKYTKDYQALLYNGSNLVEKTYFFPVYASDDVWGPDGSVWQTNLNVSIANAYCWLPRIWGLTEDDRDWADMYKTMFTLNTVITEVMTSIEGTEAQKRKAWAEALVHRAFLNLTLVDIYAKAYNPATAATDPGIPLRLDNSLFGSLKRVPVAGVYDQVMKDLQDALPYLPTLPDVVTNPSQAAVYAILAKASLNKREFSEAKRYADSALKYKSTLLDLAPFATSTTGYPTKIADPETILSKVTDVSILNVPLSDETVALFDTLDLRYKVYTQPGTLIPGANYPNRGYMKPRIVSQGMYVGPSVPEMMLIKAEGEARTNNTAGAIAMLNTLRKKRFKPAEYADLPVTTTQDALTQVINERRRELLGRGFRWFDQRRLQLDPGQTFVKPVTRVFKGVTYTLPLGSNLYTFAIADKYIQLNPEIEQNPR